jgi:hypothetical protein
MKYIRTKEKIYENILDDVLPNLEKIECQDILKQADTIEELCDCFVYGKCDYMELEEAQQEKEFYEENLQQDGQSIYGAIWTDIGLIYVAKMNEKGELELL